MTAAALLPVRAEIERLLVGEPDTLKRVLAVIASAATAAVPTEERRGPIQLQLTPTIQRNYVQREVFQRFRPEHAAKVLPNLTAVFYVSVEDAEEVLGDAKEQRAKYDGPRGEVIAWSALIRCLARLIENEKFGDCIDFPGAEKVMAERRAASAMFSEGERVAVWRDDESEGEPVTITGPYGYYRVCMDNGPYISDGDRVDYCQGYKARRDNGAENFYYAWQLAPIGESYGHLRLVKY
jgi:hypothetical protein